MDDLIILFCLSSHTCDVNKLVEAPTIASLITWLMWNDKRSMFLVLLYIQFWADQKLFGVLLISENPNMVEMVLLDLPCGMDTIRFGDIPVWGYKWPNGLKSNSSWVCEQLFWLQVWLFGCCCCCSCGDYSVIWFYLCLLNQGL